MAINDVVSPEHKEMAQKKIHAKIRTIYLATDKYNKMPPAREERLLMENVYAIASNFDLPDSIRDKYKTFDVYATQVFKRL